jgi:hypothetical protein
MLAYVLIEPVARQGGEGDRDRPPEPRPLVPPSSWRPVRGTLTQITSTQNGLEARERCEFPTILDYGRPCDLAIAVLPREDIRTKGSKRGYLRCVVGPDYKLREGRTPLADVPHPC